MKPRKNYRSRPKKHGAQRKKRITSQKKRLIAAGCKEQDLKKLNVVEIRELLKKTMKKTAKAARLEKKKTDTDSVPGKKQSISGKKDSGETLSKDETSNNEK
jgi:hypothetical protein